MAVIWLIPAQDRLQESLQAQGAKPASFSSLQKRLNAQLQATFPTAENIVVVDRLAGYSNDAKKHVLRVECVSKGRSSACVVKVGPPKKLQEELKGWQDCERPANDRGVVFMSLQPGKVHGKSRICESLVYEDAQQTFRAAEVVSLEKAVLDSCRWGTPSPASLLTVLDQIFAEMADRLYLRSWSQAANKKVCTHWKRRVRDGLSAWNDLATPAGQCRATVLQNVYGKPGLFVDVAASAEQLFTPDHVPEMQRGCSHGDLNGRNVLVGLVNGEARWPAVFDYEDMRQDNFLGWDLVKLEMELTIRASQVVFPGDDDQFLDSLLGFEEQLAKRTEELNNLPFESWRDSIEQATPRERMLALVLGIRRQAKKCLEVVHNRNRAWLHEYYFLLACYGLYAGRFVTYRRRDLLAAYLCAGHASGRYAWAQTNIVLPETDAVAAAQRALDEGRPTARLQIDAPPLSHNPEFVFAKTFVRSRQEEFVKAGAKLLEELTQRFPLAIDIWQELALGRIELYSLTKSSAALRAAGEVLSKLESKCPRPHYETLCRWGRIWKDRGDLQYDDKQPAEEHYKKALDYYDRAYELAEDKEKYYPGINVATLQRLLDRTPDSQELADRIMEDLRERPRNADAETVWILATMGEACLLLGKCDEAAEFYQRATLHAKCQPQNSDSMGKQVRRILTKQDCPDDLFDFLLQTKGD